MTPPVDTSTKPKDASVDLFRWICILSVLVHHSVFPSRQDAQTQEAIFIAKEWLSWCVTGFFFVSGWLSRPEGFVLRSVADRARRLLGPFLWINALVWGAGVVLVGMGAFVPPPEEGYAVSHVARQMLYLQGLGPQFYFLPCLFVVGTVSLGIARGIGRLPAAVAWTTIALCWSWFHGLPSTPYGGGLDRFPLYLAVFSLGMALRDGHRSRTAVAAAAVGILSGAFLAWSGKGTTLLHVFAPVALFFLVRGIVGTRQIPVLSRWNSGALYLWHAPFVHPASSILCHKLGLPGGLELLATMAVTVAVCQAIHVGVSKAGLGKVLSL